MRTSVPRAGYSRPVPRLVLALAVLALLPATALATSGKPRVCRPATIERALIDAGKLTVSDTKNGIAVDLVRCGDVTADGVADAVFTLASGGTAGDTRFGVLRGRAGRLVLYRTGYKVGIARRDARSFETLMPHYGPDDPNCCPSSFRKRRYTWSGTHFRAGNAIKLDTAPRRFYKP